jgi:MerR family transcriptional regulator/heat shock protein HspR
MAPGSGSGQGGAPPPRSRRDRSAFIGLSISIAAEQVGMHPQTLREYERQGLVEPNRTPGGARRYQDAQIERLRRIQQLTNEGLSLSGVRYVLGLEDRIRGLSRRCEQLEQRLERYEPGTVRPPQEDRWRNG